MKKKPCTWVLDNDGDTWTTGCGVLIDICERFGLPTGYDDRDIMIDFTYCPFCGKLIN